jgi:hypothetical protein
MQEQATVTPGQHDLAGPNLFGRATFDLDHIARPKRWQHAFSANLQTHPQTTAAAQNVCHQS